MIRNLGQVAAIYIGSSAPRNTNLIWLDNTVVPFVFRAYDGSAWSELATHKWVRAYVDGWLVTLPPRQLADDGDYMLINSNNVNYKITVKDFVKSAVGNPLDFKGVIRVSADFPNPSTLEAGDMYVIITSPVGGTVTDPYSGKTFEDSEKIVWDEVTRSWESLGKINITVNLTTSYSETEVTIHSSAGKETTIQGATDQLAGVMLPGQYSWLQALSNGSIVPGDPSPLTPLTPAHKHNYNDIINRLVSQQGTGESTIDPMSQKATTDALNLKFDKASVLQVSGAATDKVMSQKAVTDTLKTLSDDFNNKLTNYLPLAGGTMKGNIGFPIGNGIACNDVAGTAAYVVLRTWNANNSTRMYVGTVNFPTYISSTASDLIHDRNGSSYLLWDTYNLPTPASKTDLANYLPLAGGTLTGQVIFDSYGLAFNNIAWTNDLVPNRTYGGYLQVLDAYNASSDGGPTNYGTVLQINSRIAHWANQLWFSSLGLYHRHMAYNQTEYSDWQKILTNKDVNIIQTQSSSNPSTLPANQIFYSEIKGVAETPTTNGSLFSVQGDDEGIQLWASSSKTELYYRTKWTSYGNWIKLATTSDLGNYLPLSGGTISSSKSNPLTINSTHASQSSIDFSRGGVNKGTVGFYESLGSFLQNVTGETLAVKSDGAYYGANTDSLRKLATVTDLGSYLPLTGGKLSGQLTIEYAGSTPLIVNNSYTNGVDSILNFRVKGVNKTLVGYSNGNGPFIQDASSNRCIMVKSDGAYFGTELGAGTKLALITDIPTVSGYLPLSGGTLTGTLKINSGGPEPLVINNSASAGEAYVVTKTQGTTRGVMGWNSSLGMFLQDNRGYTFSVKADGVYFGASSSTLTKLLTSADLSSYATQSWCNGQFAPLSRFNTSTGYTTIKVTGQEFNFDSANPEIYMNYRTLSGSTAVTKITWKAGGGANSTALCEGRWGNLYMNNNLVATQSWAAEKFPNKTGTGASGTWGISITGNATTATTASKLGSTTIGGSAKPIYLSSGTPTACSATVGSTTVPVYMNAGTITQCSTTLGVSITGNAATATNSTQLGGTAASSYVKANDNISRLTNDSGFITSSALNGYATQSWVNSQNFVKSTSTKKVTDIQPVDALPATQASGVLYLVFG